ncbi:MAG: deoxyribose-phosphate aldolase [Bacilli bacterium]|nr:deoxyribose-phosphate aldolase [Bacilli bacterium]
MEINKLFDHTLLKPEATEADVIKICEEAKKYDFASVCVNPCHVELVAKELEGTDVKVCTVIGFPLGNNCPIIKAEEALLAVRQGADEVDTVLNVGQVKAKRYDLVEEDIAMTVKSAKSVLGKEVIVKVILESALLTDEEIAEACKACVKAGADFVKTSTGFNKAGGASAHAVKIMRDTVGPNIGVKASGGIHSKADVDAMVEAGASRIGCSASVAIMNEN